MEKSIGEIINLAHPSQELSLKKVLESFSHIDLTEDEVDEALIMAKRKKEILLEERAKIQRVEENRKIFIGSVWTTSQTDSFMRHRAVNLFNKKFNFDGQVAIIYTLLVTYFSRDPEFVSIARSLDIDNPSLDKGLYLGGNFGVGKTWLMKLFQRNQRQVYALQNAKAIADLFEKDGEESIVQFAESPSLPVNDIENFCHKRMGLCIDDLGTEQIKTHYGNKKNVIGDIIELRYAKENVGSLLHVTTNLTGNQLKEFYGPRIASRFRETMNIIDFIGDDLRR